MLISMIGIANTVARLAVGFISDRPWADCLLINNMALILAGGTTAFVPFYRIYGVLITYSILFGSGIGKYIIMMVFNELSKHEIYNKFDSLFK